MEVVERLREEQRGVEFLCMKTNMKPGQRINSLNSQMERSPYGHIINCRLHADRVAHSFGIGENFTFAIWADWKLKENCPIQPRTNLYPVPDLNVPFLGVHFTPSADNTPIVNIGPTATVAFGRENYRGFEAIEPRMTSANVAVLARQYLMNRGGFRRYVHEQAFLALPHLLIRAAQELIPNVKPEHIELSSKVGIRSQLFNRTTERLEDDFLCLPGPCSTHVLNAPCFYSKFCPGRFNY